MITPYRKMIRHCPGPARIAIALALMIANFAQADDQRSEDSTAGGQEAPASTDHGIPTHSDSINEWRSFREDELRQLERRREDAKSYSKFSEATLTSLSPTISAVRPSTVELLDAHSGRLCYGIIIDPAGHVLTKASEVAAAGDRLQCRFIGGITVEASVSDMFQPYDLALVKVNATGLTAIQWELASSEEPGTLVIAAGIEKTPLSYGVLSVAARRLNPGFLGVQLSDIKGGAQVETVLAQSAAIAAGIKGGDLIVAVDGISVANRESLITTIKKFSVGEEVKITLQRGDAELEVMVLLGSRFAAIPDPNHDMLDRMDVKLSTNRIDYPSALQHDLPLDPNQCGGPLVNLDGQVIGMNIARAGRIRSLAIPAADLTPLLNAASEGRFSIPDANAVSQQLKAATQAVTHAEKALASAIAKANNLERSLENLKKYRLPADIREQGTGAQSGVPAGQTEEEPDGDGGETDPAPIP